MTDIYHVRTIDIHVIRYMLYVIHSYNGYHSLNPDMYFRKLIELFYPGAQLHLCISKLHICRSIQICEINIFHMKHIYLSSYSN